MENSLKCHWTLKNVQTFRAEPFISVKKPIVASWHTPYEETNVESVRARNTAIKFPAVETMRGLGTNFATEGFWDYLGGHGKFVNWRQCINPDITHQKYRWGCRSLWIAASLAARTIFETTLESSIIEFLRMKRYEDDMKSWSVMQHWKSNRITLEFVNNSSKVG